MPCVRVRVNGIRASDPHVLNTGHGLMFCLGSRVQEETPEEGWRIDRPKHVNITVRKLWMILKKNG